MKLNLPYPISVNKMYQPAGRRIILTQAARDYKEAVGWMLRVCQCEPAYGRFKVEVHAFGHGDIDNLQKLLLDSMEGHVYFNDRQVKEMHVYMEEPCKPPYLVVDVNAL